MAINKHEADFCGSPDKINQTLELDEVVRCRSEVMEITEQSLEHFLFTPSNNGIVNGVTRPYPNLAKLFNSFVPQDQSLVFALKAPAEFSYFVEDLIKKRYKTYRELLLRYSVRIIPTTETEYRLSGGSFAGVHLSLVNEHRWKISKMIRRDFGDVDADIRLLEEGRFISNLPAQTARLFPKVNPDDIIERPDQVGYNMEYCPFPTIAELVFSKHITPEQTVEFLAGIYDAMFTRVYCLDEDPSKQDDDYFGRIDRRMDRVLSSPEGIGES
jgi:hypothetical protein